MTRKAITPQPRREFLKLAGFTGAAALTGQGPSAAAEQTAAPQSAESSDANDNM